MALILRDHPANLRVRDAKETDLSALCHLKPGRAIHSDRIRDAESPTFRYLVLVKDDEVIGFACLVFVRPSSWSDADDRSNLPQIVDLLVSVSQRSRGYGSYFIQQLEQIAAQNGSRSLYIPVDFPANEGAHALYRRLGYQQIQPPPYLIHWELTDSEGHIHQGDDWRVDMIKSVMIKSVL